MRRRHRDDATDSSCRPVSLLTFVVLPAYDMPVRGCCDSAGASSCSINVVELQHFRLGCHSVCKDPSKYACKLFIQPTYIYDCEVCYDCRFDEKFYASGANRTKNCINYTCTVSVLLDFNNMQICG